MKKQTLVTSVIAIILLAGTALFIFQYQQPHAQTENKNTVIANTACIKENQKNFGEAPVVYQCCPGLKDIAAINDRGVRTFDVSYCTNCGNTKCQQPENKYNCPEDCT